VYPGCGPFAFLHAVVEPYKPPPRPFDEDRHEDHRADPQLPGEEPPLALGEVPDVAVHWLAPPEDLLPPPEGRPGVGAGGPIWEVGDGGAIRAIRNTVRSPRGHPLVELAVPQPPVVSDVVSEDVHTARLGGPAQPPEPP